MRCLVNLLTGNNHILKLSGGKVSHIASIQGHEYNRLSKNYASSIFFIPIIRNLSNLPRCSVLRAWIRLVYRQAGAAPMDWGACSPPPTPETACGAKVPMCFHCYYVKSEGSDTCTLHIGVRFMNTNPEACVKVARGGHGVLKVANMTSILLIQFCSFKFYTHLLIIELDIQYRGTARRKLERCVLCLCVAGRVCIS